MSIAHDPPKRDYVNVMEILVAEEVDRQLKQLAPRVSKYVKRLEVETYALNRLPSLYASSEKGWEHQYEKAKHTHRSQITKAVMQALAAVQVDPIRSSRPLSLKDDKAQVALHALRDMLRQPDLTWEEVVEHLKPLLKGDKAMALPQPSSQVSSEEHHHRYWRPGTYGTDVSWKPKQTNSHSNVDWSDGRYNK